MAFTPRPSISATRLKSRIAFPSSAEYRPRSNRQRGDPPPPPRPRERWHISPTLHDPGRAVDSQRHAMCPASGILCRRHSSSGLASNKGPSERKLSALVELGRVAERGESIQCFVPTGPSDVSTVYLCRGPGFSIRGSGFRDIPYDDAREWPSARHFRAHSTFNMVADSRLLGMPVLSSTASWVDGRQGIALAPFPAQRLPS